MKAFLEFVIGQLTDRPEEIVLREETSGGIQTFLLELPPSEVGKVIGKQGYTIQAIRSLLATAASRQGGRATLEIVEP